MATQTHSPFETLARVIEHLDDGSRSVRRTEAEGSGEDGSLRATVAVSVALSEEHAALEPTDAVVDEGLAVTFRAPTFPDPAEALPAEYPQVSATPTDVRLDGDAVVVTLDVAISDGDRPDGGDTTSEDEMSDATVSAAPSTFGSQSTGEGTDSDTSDADGSGSDMDGAGDASPCAAVRDESVPPYDDTPYLRRLYETCETFAEMSERIEMDVSAETVRRYMIEADVHSPTSYETAETPTDGETPAEPTTVAREESAADGDPETAASLPDKQLVADGIGLPEELTLHDVVDAVVDARTVHEVQREVSLDYDRTRQLLCQLNVLDLVVGRVASGDRTVTVDVVADRIRQCAPDTA